MFTTGDLLATLLVGLAVGALAGAVAWEVLVAERLRRRHQRHVWRLEDRALRWQRIALEDAVEARAAAQDNARWSRKAPNLRVAE